MAVPASVVVSLYGAHCSTISSPITLGTMGGAYTAENLRDRHHGSIIAKAKRTALRIGDGTRNAEGFQPYFSYHHSTVTFGRLDPATLM